MKAEVAAENELVARLMFESGDYVGCLLLIHALVEGALRNFLRCGESGTFNAIVGQYRDYLISEGQKDPLLVEELTQFNRRRNRVVHGLWLRGYHDTNEGHRLDDACKAGMVMLELLSDYVSTFAPRD